MAQQRGQKHYSETLAPPKGFFSGPPAPDKALSKNCQRDWVLFSRGHSLPPLLCLQGPGPLCLSDFFFSFSIPSSKIIPIPSPSSNSKLLYTEVTLWGLKWLEHPSMNGLTPPWDVCLSEEVLEIEMYLINKEGSCSSPTAKLSPAKLVCLESPTSWYSSTYPSAMGIEFRKANFLAGRESVGKKCKFTQWIIDPKW